MNPTCPTPGCKSVSFSVQDICAKNTGEVVSVLCCAYCGTVVGTLPDQQLIANIQGFLEDLPNKVAQTNGIPRT